MELDIEPNLLNGDIAQGSYNFGQQNTFRGHDERKLLFRTSKDDQFRELQFSKPLQDLENCKERCECKDCHRSSKYYCGGMYVSSIYLCTFKNV